MALNGKKKKFKEVWVHRKIWEFLLNFEKQKKGGGGSAFHSYEELL